MNIELSESEMEKKERHIELIEKIIGKVKNIGMELHRAIPNEWNSFMEICLAGSITD